MKTYVNKIVILGMLTIITSCVQKEHTKTVTFKVAMNHLETIGEVGIKGEFTNPPWEQILPLMDADGDGIFEATFTKETAQSAVEFKFVHNGKYELKGQDNRVLRMEYLPETLVYEAMFDNPDGKQYIIEN